MKVQMAYGRTGLEVDLPDLPPDRLQIVEPRYVPGLPDEAAAIRAALRHPIGTPPLRDLVRPDDTVAVVFCDLTRPMPNDRVLPVLLAELESVVPRERITLLNGTGTHRANTPEELRRMLGPSIAAGYRIVTHNARDPSTLEYVGTTSFGHRVLLNRAYLQASVRILTGFIEPHFFAGFSGGPKMVLPAIAGIETVLGNHSAPMIGHPQATWAVTEGNPVWEEIREGCLLARPTFSLNVTLNKDHAITGVFAGEVLLSHREGTAWARQTIMQPVAEPFDIVLTTNSGYPLDLNVYQAIKGVSAAARILKDGGAIIAAAECWDGIPDHGNYKDLLFAARSPQELLERIHQPGFLMPDQWEAQIQAQIQLRARVYLYSSLPNEVVRRTHLLPCGPIRARLEQLLAAYGPAARLCVLPQGPQTVPYIDPSAAGRERRSLAARAA